MLNPLEGTSDVKSFALRIFQAEELSKRIWANTPSSVSHVKSLMPAQASSFIRHSGFMGFLSAPSSGTNLNGVMNTLLNNVEGHLLFLVAGVH